MNSLDETVKDDLMKGLLLTKNLSVNSPENVSNLEEDMLMDGFDETVRDGLMKSLSLMKDPSVNSPENISSLEDVLIDGLDEVI